MNDEIVAELSERRRRYLELHEQYADGDGFVYTDECDSLLFSCLSGLDYGINVSAARDPNGQWFRRPLAYPECLKCSGAKSTISKDMFVGLAWYAYVAHISQHHEDANNISASVIDYGLKHNWVMGEGPLSRTLLTSGLISTFAEILRLSGGKDHPILRRLPNVDWLSTWTTGYERHLACLHLLLRKRLGFKVNESLFNRFAANEHMNPLYLYAAGYKEDAAKRLLAMFPKDHLPDSHDWKDRWPLQRDYGDGWLPDLTGPYRQHCGGDFLFVSGLILDYY